MQTGTIIRLAIFLTVFATFAVCEYRSPRRRLTVSKKKRWTANLVIIIANPLILHLVFPLLALDMAAITTERGWGLLALFAWPYWLKTIVGIMILDLVVYLQHVMFHAVPIFWRLHMMHHSDLDFDLTTGLRFHPIEILLSMGIKMAAICAIGPPLASVLVFEIALSSMAMFNHGNFNIPKRWDRLLRYIVVTPDMHRVHHSVVIREINSNFGFNLSVWDRLFGTYRSQPEKGHEGMTIGLSQFRDQARLSVYHLILLPFKGDTGRVPMNW